MSKTVQTLSVAVIESVTVNVKRVTFTGNLADYSIADKSGYIKLLLSDEQGNDYKRSFTIRDFCPNKQHLIIDFIVHTDGGPASKWLNSAKVGDTVEVVGPGAKKLVDFNADWFFLVGDLTALPAIAVNLEMLPAHSQGYAIIEVRHEDDCQSITHPDGVTVEWVVNSDNSKSAELVLNKVKTKEWLPGSPYVWVASEFESMRALRYYFKNEKAVSRDFIYASSYWKIGETDEGNKRAKKQDFEA